MEKIYNGNEENLADILIELTIKECNINPGDITQINIDCFMPKNDSFHLWEIKINIFTINNNYTEYYYSKDCIYHGYRITYLQHLKIMGKKKIKIKDMFKDD